MKTSSALVAVLLSLGLGASAQVPGSVPGRPVAPATPPTGMVPVIYQGAGSVSGPGREGGGVTVNPGTNYFTAKNVPIYGSVEVTASHGLSCLMYFSGQANVSGIGFLGKGQVDGWGYVQGTCDLADKSGRVVTTIGMDEGVKVTGSSDGTFVHIHGDFPISGVVSVDASKLPQDSSRPDELIMIGSGQVSGQGGVSFQSDPYWFSGAFDVSGEAKLKGPDGEHATVPVTGNAYIQWHGYRAVGQAKGTAEVSGTATVYDRNNKPIGKATIDHQPVTVTVNNEVGVDGWANGGTATVSGTGTFETWAKVDLR